MPGKTTTRKWQLERGLIYQCLRCGLEGTVFVFVVQIFLEPLIPKKDCINRIDCQMKLCEICRNPMLAVIYDLHLQGCLAEVEDYESRLPDTPEPMAISDNDSHNNMTFDDSGPRVETI